MYAKWFDYLRHIESQPTNDSKSYDKKYGKEPPAKGTPAGVPVRGIAARRERTLLRIGTTSMGCIIAGVNIVYLILFYYNFCRRHYETIES